MRNKGALWILIVVVVILLGAGYYLYKNNSANADVATTASISSSGASSTGNGYYKTIIKGTCVSSTVPGQALAFRVRVDQGLSEMIGKTITVVAAHNSTTYTIAASKTNSNAFYYGFSDYYDSYMGGKQRGVPVGKDLMISGFRTTNSNANIVSEGRFLADEVTEMRTEPSSVVSATPTSTVTSAATSTPTTISSFYTFDTKYKGAVAKNKSSITVKQGDSFDLQINFGKASTSSPVYQISKPLTTLSLSKMTSDSYLEVKPVGGSAQVSVFTITAKKTEAAAKMDDSFLVTDSANGSGRFVISIEP